MTGKIDPVEIITSVPRRRRWSAEEKARIVQETWAPGMSVSLVAQQHGIAPNQLFTWRRLYAEGALSAVGAGEEVVPASDTGRCSTKYANCNDCSSRHGEIHPTRAREETLESRGIPCLFLNTERGFGGKPPKKSRLNGRLRLERSR